MSSAMPINPSKQTDWMAKADEARQMASNEPDPAIRTWLQGVAREYERLAAQPKKHEEK
jgi:hypothetical protein